MTNPPGFAYRYRIVPYTRGKGIEVGGGKLYPHFKGEDEATPGLDFVFVPTPKKHDYQRLLNQGGYLVEVVNDCLRVRTMEADRTLRDLEIPFARKRACVVRYGGFGDSIQAASILPELQREGFHVTFMTTPRGYDILKHDPHIDAWLIQDDNQVPNHLLFEYWAEWEKTFDRFVNLSESIEGTLLAYPGRANHSWPHAVRKQELDKNYLEWTAMLAQVAFRRFEGHFYPSDAEHAASRDYLNDFKLAQLDAVRPMTQTPKRFTLMWCLSGSSIHKFYPLQDAVIARIMAKLPDALIVLTGDEACRLLESGWEKNPRIRCESGKMGIRETLSLAQSVDCVVGPETGVLNAVAFEDNAKVVLLSHSSKNNLTKHWVNTVALEPENTACYPCHQIHLDSSYCQTNPSTGAAVCQHDIHQDRVYEAIERSYSDWQLIGNLVESCVKVCT